MYVAKKSPRLWNLGFVTEEGPRPSKDPLKLLFIDVLTPKQLSAYQRAAILDERLQLQSHARPPGIEIRALLQIRALWQLYTVHRAHANSERQTGPFVQCGATGHGTKGRRVGNLVAHTGVGGLTPERLATCPSRTYPARLVAEQLTRFSPAYIGACAGRPLSQGINRYVKASLSVSSRQRER